MPYAPEEVMVVPGGAFTMAVSPVAALAVVISFAGVTPSLAEPEAYHLIEPLPTRHLYQTTALSPGEQNDWDRIEACIRAVDFENGVAHPAEPLIERFVARFGGANLVRVARRWERGEAELFATLLRLAGRVPAINHAVRRDLVVEGLRSPVSDVRDAAMQAIETSRAHELVLLLAAHQEPDPFLDDYKNGIIEDLTG